MEENINVFLVFLHPAESSSKTIFSGFSFVYTPTSSVGGSDAGMFPPSRTLVSSPWFWFSWSRASQLFTEPPVFI